MLEPAPVVITGGSGVLGSAIARHLLAAGRSVAGLARTDEAAAILAELGVPARSGDILDYNSLVDAFAGADVVYHVAGVNQFCLRDPSPMYRANVEGTQNVIKAAAATGVRRVVYTSSAIVLGESQGTLGAENSRHRGTYLSHYERSKHEAEDAAFAAAGGIELVVVNPSSVQGPGRASGTGRLILDVVKGRLRVLVDTNLSIVDIDDCARGHLLAESKGVPGERYVLNGISLSLREAVALLEHVLGSELSIRFLPRAVARAAIPVLDGLKRMGRVPFCAEMIRALLHGHVYDGSKATRELGLVYTPLETTLRRTIEWFRAEGMTSA